MPDAGFPAVIVTGVPAVTRANRPGAPVARRVAASSGPKISCRTGQAFAFAHRASRPGISLPAGAPVSAGLPALRWAEWFSTWRPR